MQGLIIENISNTYKIKTENGIYDALARGKLKKDEIIPVVGDIVEFQKIKGEENKFIIEKIFERKNYCKRPKVSNLTQMIYIVSSKEPKPDLLLLDKQLAFAEFLKINAIIVFNKIDVDKKREAKKIKEIYQKIGYKVYETQAKERKGVEELIKILKNNVNAFSGNSGVGKSTLINAIFKKDMTQEGEVSKKNKRGKNTTTAIKMYEIDKNTYITDTPGFSTFSIEEIQSKDLAKYFKEFVKYQKECEFLDCTHTKEQKCGIKKAIENGYISKDRYQRFCKIYEELKEKEARKW